MDGQAQVRLVFAGELLEGHALGDVKRIFGELFKLEGDRLAAVFSGKRTVLKRTIGRDDGERYAARLLKIGMRVHIEPVDALPELKPLPAAVAASTPAGLASLPADLPGLVPLEEEVTCPNCNERQPKKFVLCRQCTTDIPRALASKAEDAEKARAERLAARQGGRFAPPTADVDGGEMAYSSDDAPPFWGFGFSGRLGRINYLLAGYATIVLAGLVGVLSAVLIPLTRSAWMAIVALPLMLAVMVWGIRATVLRLHDVNRSGLWALVFILPIFPFLPTLFSGGRSVPGSMAMTMYFIFSVVNFLMGVTLLIYPGTHGDNDHGGPARRGNGLLAIVCTLAFALAFAIYMNFAFKAYNDYSGRARRQQQQQQQPGTPADSSQQQDAASPAAAARLPKGPAEQAFRDQYLPASNEKAFAVSSAGAYGFSTGKLSVREAISSALADCETRREAYTGQCRVVNVNGASPERQ